ncbi:hypothetical protein HAX54_028364 [Datura stramonium]|uniref:Secreted protein n=1 Tax=Datura stramonium TaxID=4076 RepID=A0ABS8V4D2_DATST|nr:hypothetical protein [Datura stramonium]
MHLWETGIMRITRHPQVIWCLAHALWIGEFSCSSSLSRSDRHHLFGAWNGDRRLGPFDMCGSDPRFQRCQHEKTKTNPPEKTKGEESSSSVK